MVEAGALPLGIGVKTETTTTIEQGFEKEVGESETETIENEVAATITIPPHHNCDLTVVGQLLEIDVPYTADLITKYTDGTEKSSPTSGIFNGVETTHFHVQYGACTGIRSSFTTKK